MPMMTPNPSTRAISVSTARRSVPAAHPGCGQGRVLVAAPPRPTGTARGSPRPRPAARRPPRRPGTARWPGRGPAGRTPRPRTAALRTDSIRRLGRLQPRLDDGLRPGREPHLLAGVREVLSGGELRVAAVHDHAAARAAGHHARGGDHPQVERAAVQPHPGRERAAGAEHRAGRPPRAAGMAGWRTAAPRPGAAARQISRSARPRIAVSRSGGSSTCPGRHRPAADSSPAPAGTQPELPCTCIRVMVTDPLTGLCSDPRRRGEIEILQHARAAGERAGEGDRRPARAAAPRLTGEAPVRHVGEQQRPGRRQAVDVHGDADRAAAAGPPGPGRAGPASGPAR